MRKLKVVLLSIICVLILFSAHRSFAATQPKMSDYTHYPLFQVNGIEPNILIILDNSGSMNFNAYGSWPGNGGIVTDSPYLGEPYRGISEARVSQASDDAEEIVGDTYNSYDLDLGSVSVVGIRFQNLDIPKCATITKAYITFEASPPANGTNLEATSLTFHGQANDDPPTFIMGINYNVSNRPDTAASVTWDNVPTWTDHQIYQTPDLSIIIQEIVNRDGWSNGNAIVFKVTGWGCREAKAYNGSSPDLHGPLLHVEYIPAEWSRYYGYFNPDYFYYWDTNKFNHKYKKVQYIGDPSSDGYWSVLDLNGNPHNLLDTEIVNSGLWDGNWLNWLCMRRIDVLRKVLMGGLATARTGGGNQVNYGETPSYTESVFMKKFNTTTGSAVSPYDGNYHYRMDGGYIDVDNDNDLTNGYIERFNIAIQKNILYEPEDFYNYNTGDNLSGVLQKIGNKARWGNEWFNGGTGFNESGGYISATIGTNMVSIVTDLQNTSCNTHTPLAEAYYVAMQYFKQEDVQAGLDYPNNVVPNDNLGQDPYYNNGQHVDCAGSFVILLTDGVSTKDSMIPDSLKDFDQDGLDNTNCDESSETNCDFPTGGTDYLDDIALYARTTDLRINLDGSQNLVLYTIYAFGSDSNAENLLKNAAKNGGFEDRNGNNRPDLQEEWDVDNDGIPDTFYRASTGYELESKLLEAINDILKRAASGTSVSVLATTSKGEGIMTQAYFRPVQPVGLEEVKWLGYLQSLWIDTYGYVREDTIQDSKLDVTQDKVITYFLDTATGDTMIKRYNVSSTKPYPDIQSDTYETLQLDQISPLWEAGSRLAQRNPSTRNLFTYIDKDKDGQVDESTDDPFDDSGEVVRFHTGSASYIKPYLGVKDNSAWAYLGATHDDRVINLINYIRGNDVSGLRSRTINGSVWKLGDIVNSTPLIVSKPAENYHIIYSDESYQAYFSANKNRETVVYVGGNDGMLHAFTSWQYNSSTNTYTGPSGTTEQIGDELWAFVPQSLLPHLKWLPSPDYTHVDYVDLKPKIFDAKIDHDKDVNTPDEWRTLLIAGLNMGGKHIWAADAFDDGSGNVVSETRNFYPSYTCIDVTDPRNPRLLWERSYVDLEMTTSFPSVLKVKNKWFVVFGSGPSNYDGTSTKPGHIFVVDLETGEPYRNGGNDWLFETAEANAFMNSPVTLDKNLNFNADAIYFGETYYASTNWYGKLYKVTIPWVDAYGAYDGSDVSHYSDNPTDATNPWQLSALFKATKPITAPVALSVDEFDNAWIYVGSGRYLSTADKTTTDTQYMFGIKDPFFNADHTQMGLYNTDYYHNYGVSLELQVSDLFNADPYVVIEEGYDIYDNNDTRIGSFDDLLALAQEKNGWLRSLENQGERILAKSTVLGGIVYTPSFVPNVDVCGFGGGSYLHAYYYETGTAYRKKALIEKGIKTVQIQGQDMTKVKDRVFLGAGAAAALGIQVGAGGEKALIQQSTGVIINEQLNPALNIKSCLRSWIDQ
jgi:type IV pilus assembly protein PilY1